VNIALFGGTFDPIHTGHLRAAKAACRKFQLDQVLFIPSGHPPHKINGHLTEFAHRYAMVALACGNEPRFIPSLLESPTPNNRPQYSIETARAVARRLHPGDRLYFIVGVDALLDLRNWRNYRGLLDLVNFIVVTRPGWDASKIWGVLPEDMTSPSRSPGLRAIGRAPVAIKLSAHGRRSTRSDSIKLPRTTLHLLSGIHVPVASRDIRQAVAFGTTISGLVPPSVERYISKEGLYKPAVRRGSAGEISGRHAR
jgi:nicotinate-nucleotide adenylyltransferase